KESSAEARAQRDHYDRVASSYLRNLAYPHTEEYTRYLDEALRSELGTTKPATVAEICCGGGDGLRLLRDRFERGIGVDVSVTMLEAAARETSDPSLSWVQGDATRLPVADATFGGVVALGGS